MKSRNRVSEFSRSAVRIARAQFARPAHYITIEVSFQHEVLNLFYISILLDRPNQCIRIETKDADDPPVAIGNERPAPSSLNARSALTEQKSEFDAIFLGGYESCSGACTHIAKVTNQGAHPAPPPPCTLSELHNVRLLFRLLIKEHPRPHPRTFHQGRLALSTLYRDSKTFVPSCARPTMP